MSLGIVHGGLQAVGIRRQFFKFRHRRAVNLLNAFMRGVRVVCRQDGVAHDPVEIVALAHSGGPMVQAPIADRIIGGAGRRDEAAAGIHPVGAQVIPPANLPGLVILAPGQVERLLSSGCERGSSGGELPFVHVSDRDGLAQDRHRLDARHPIEVGIHQQ